MSNGAALEAADLLRRDLLRSFGGVVFQVTVMTAYETSTIEVLWTDGPPLYAVDVIARETMTAVEGKTGTGQGLSLRISKRRMMSAEAEEKILSLLRDALGTRELDMDRIHPIPPMLARPESRFMEGTVPEFRDLLFELMSFCEECLAPARGGDVPCPCIIVRGDR